MPCTFAQLASGLFNGLRVTFEWEKGTPFAPLNQFKAGTAVSSALAASILPNQPLARIDEFPKLIGELLLKIFDR